MLRKPFLSCRFLSLFVPLCPSLSLSLFLLVSIRAQGRVKTKTRALLQREGFPTQAHSTLLLLPPLFLLYPWTPRRSFIASWNWENNKAPWQQPQLAIGSLSYEAFLFQMSIPHPIASLQASKSWVMPLIMPRRPGLWGEVNASHYCCMLAHCTMHYPQRRSITLFLGNLVCVCVCVSHYTICS